MVIWVISSFILAHVLTLSSWHISSLHFHSIWFLSHFTFPENFRVTCSYLCISPAQKSSQIMALRLMAVLLQNAARNHPWNEPHMALLKRVTSTTLFAHWQEKSLREMFLYSADVYIFFYDSSASVLLFFHVHIPFCPYLNWKLLVGTERSYNQIFCLFLSRVFSYVFPVLYGGKSRNMPTWVNQSPKWLF